MTYRFDPNAGVAWWGTFVLCAGAAVVQALGSASIAEAYCAYVTHDDVVSVIDTASNTVAATIPVGSVPWGVAATRDGRFVYVANCGASCIEGAPSEDRVSVIDTATNVIVATVHVGMGPSFLAFTPDGATAYVANCGTWCSKGVHSGFSVSVIDTAEALVDPEHAVTATIPNIGPGVIAITPHDTFAGGIFAYVANWDPDTVSVIDTATNTVRTTIPIGLGGVSGGIAITPDGHWAYLPAGSRSEHLGSVIDLTTNAVAATIPGMGGGFVTISPDGERAYAVVAGGDLPTGLAVVDTTSNVIVRTIPGVSGYFPAITPDGAFVYVPSSHDSTIAVIDTGTNALHTISAGGGTQGGIAIASPAMCVDGHPTCVGDCSVDRQVTVNEIITMVNIALGSASMSTCDAGDANHDGQITVSEIIIAVNHALSGC